MSNLSRLTVPMCGLLIGSTALLGIALHEQAAVALTGPTAEPLIATVPVAAEVVADRVRVTTPELAPPLDRADPRVYGFVIAVGGATYVQLSTDATELAAVTTGRAHRVDVDGDHDAYATIAAAQLPARLHDWIGKRVVVDGTCTANVVGFAKIARLSGDTAYARMAAGDGTWTARDVIDHGASMIAAKLDGCTGTWARDAALPAAIVGIPLTSTEELAAAIRGDLARTDAATAQAAEWARSWPDEDFRTHLREVALETRVVVHPLTGERWVFAHAHEGESCGAPVLNLMGVYRLAPDGTPVRVEAYVSTIDHIDALVDVDRDGRFEMRAMDGDLISDPALLDRDGTAISTTSVPFFGCPC